MSAAVSREGVVRRFKRYPEYKDSGVEWLGEIPAHWGVNRLKHVASINDQVLAENTDPNLEISYVDIGDVDSVHGITKSQVLLFANAPSRARRVVRDGDVIVSTVRTYLRAIATIVDLEPNTVVSTGFAVIRPIDLETSFAGYAIRAPYFVERMVANSVGVGYPAINSNEMACLSVAYPDTDEQRAIAAFLDRETAKIDALVAKRERLIGLLEEKRSALITVAVTKGLDPNVPMKESGVEWLQETPAHWEVVPLKRLLNRCDYGISESLVGTGNIRVLTMAHIQGGEVLLPESGSVAEVPDELILDRHDLLFNRTNSRELVGKVALFRGSRTDRVSFASYLVRMTARDRVSPTYLNFLLNSSALIGLARSMAMLSVNQANLNPTRYTQIYVPLPAPREQQAIANYLDAERTRMIALTTKVRSAIDRLESGPDACVGDALVVREEPPPYGDHAVPGGYRKRTKDDYDRTLCLIPRDLIDFILGTQAKEWEKLKQHHGAEVKDLFLRRLAGEIERRGALDVLRNGIKDSGCKFRLAYFRPSSGLNEELQRLHAANLFSVVRQLYYSEKNDNCLDLALFLNGIPIFTAELKNALTGQNVEDAIRQYKTTRDPREPLFVYGRCLAHFAVDPDLVYVTTHLLGSKTRFLPLNQGKFGGAGNPPVPPTQNRYATAYLWERIWARDSLLDLIRQFVHEVEEEDEKGRKTGKRFLIFPRYQQLDAVRRLVSHARGHGPGERYLIQHSAGSGKSFTIAWLAHQLSTLHDLNDRRVFDSIVVITDRRVLDRQLQQTVRQFEQTLGVVENIDTTSRQLKEALESGKTIIVTTLQKFPVIANQIGELPGQRFAVIVDEAHSSQSGESTKSLKSVLAVKTLEEAEREEEQAATPEEELEDIVLAEMQKRGRLSNLSVFAFTATPKPKTLELFGTKRPDGKFEPFHLYRMRQAIEEGFILDVLENYTTYKAYWRLLKTIEDDPRYDKAKASYLLKSFVELHPHAIGEKVRIMLEHFAAHVQDQIGAKAKAIIVTRSRLHAVRYRLAVDRYLAERGYPFRALVAFSGTVKDDEQSYTEAGMNGFSERQTAKTFEGPEFRFLIVANKFQTGFDQPLLHTMYVDKKLGGVNAVQTLSRLNRTHPEKRGTMVLDFANEADEIRTAFEPYFETTLLSEATDPNLLYELQGRLLGHGIYTAAEVDGFAQVYFDRKATQAQLYAVLAPITERFRHVDNKTQHDFGGELTDYVRLYAFLSQVLTFADADLEKLYVLAKHLRRLIPAGRDELPREVQQNIDMESYRIQETGSGKIKLDRQTGQLEPQRTSVKYTPGAEELEPLSRIIEALNERFGLKLGPEHRVTLGQMMGKLDEDAALDASARVNTRENVRLTFDHKVDAVIQEIVDSNFDLYKRITDDRAFGQAIKNFLFDQYLRAHRQADELLKQHESKTLEFKSTLRWNMRENRKDDVVTHAVIKTIAAFLNTEGGDLLIGVADDKSVIGIAHDQFENEDRFMLHLFHVVRNGMGDRAGTCIDPKMQVVQGKTVCLVSCQRSPEQEYLKAKVNDELGDFYVRSGPGTVKLSAESAKEYVRTRWNAS